jgi:dipeptidyl aminopeptidase/acylaminoacyl peptidase
VGTWAPDGRRFFFYSSDVSKEEKDRSGVYIYDEASGDITLFSYKSGLPRWSRDGKTMTWTTGKQVRQLWMMENYGTE